MNPRTILAAWSVLSLVVATATAAQPIPLINSQQPLKAWSFGNGAEFPGAKGELAVASDTFQDQPALRLHGNFSQGGNYVQAQIHLPETPVETLSFWVNVPRGVSQLPIRLIDGSGQCHQLRLKLGDKGGWQQLVLPVDEFFRKMGTAAALDLASQYEKWSGANDGRWHQPGKLLVFLCTRAMGEETNVLISDVQLHPSPATTDVKQTIPLDETLQAGEIDWDFNLGQEFPGAQGGLELAKDQPQAGENALRMHADFQNGGAYVGLKKSFEHLDVKTVNAIRLRMRSTTAENYSLRLVDGSGQCHQRKSIPFTADGNWHNVEIVPAKIAGGEHWGGANDGRWHGGLRLMELMLNPRSHAGNTPELLLSDIRAEVVVAARPTPAAFAQTFDALDALPGGWTTQGDVALASSGAGDSQHALTLQRTLENLEQTTRASSPAFAVTAGAWQVQFAWKADLHSPDNSYQGSVALQVRDRSGDLLETIPVGLGFGKSEWQTVSQTVTLPPAAATAVLIAQLNKTYGVFQLDNLSAARLSVQPIQQRVERILLATDAVGNLFLPESPIVFHVTVEASQPLPASQRVLRHTVRDYWATDQLPPGEVSLTPAERKDGRYRYQVDLTLPRESLHSHKFYELHVAVPQDLGDPVTEYSGFAILPTAATKALRPSAVPFTIRNWDSRVPAYFQLSDRLGLRQLGVWGGFSSKPPYQPHLPGVETIEKLNASWITGTPAAQIEREGFKTYTEESLRQGMRNFLAAYADRGLEKIALGNEPHGQGDKVLDNVKAYKAIYETVKAYNPDIHVLGTSVEPNEEYFLAGYQNYLDSYDFHIYEHYSKVRDTMREYRALMEKYHAVKPIHSTELGLNSQGQTRLAVSREMIKKCTVFFAEGGDTVSWFTIQYPDPQGKARGQFGDSHCVFDCKYSLYNPRLDAITYYHVINGIADKKFIAEQHDDNGVQAYLFGNAAGENLQICWLDGDRRDVLIPLPEGQTADQTVKLLHLDGARQTLHNTLGGVSLTLDDNPVMLLYSADQSALAPSLGTPTAKVETPPAPIKPGGSTTFQAIGPGLTASSLQTIAPHGWKTTIENAGENRAKITLTAPPATASKQFPLRLVLLKADKPIGELTVPIEVATP